MFRKLTFLRGRRLLHGGRETGPHCGWGAWGVCLRVILLCSGVGRARGRQERASQFLPQDPSPVQAAKRGPAGQDTRPRVTRVAVQLMEQQVLWTYTCGSPPSGPERRAVSQTWLWYVEGSLQLWLRYLTAALSCVQLDLSFCSAWEIHRRNPWNPLLVVVSWGI